MKLILTQIEHAGLLSPWFFVVLFVVASLLMVWRLEAMSEYGMEGTVLGTLVMPYCSGLGNIIFAFLLAKHGGSGADVMTNCLVNNVTNLTLLIGGPALLWGLSVVPQREGKAAKRSKGKNATIVPQINRLSLLLTLVAAFFFTACVWALLRDGKLDFGDGLVLIGIFLFWQCIHVFEVLKSNVRQNRSFGIMLLFDLLVLGIGAYAIYISVDWLVNWITGVKTGFFSAAQLGWLSGWLMVLPNALLAMYYGWRRKAEVIYSSQVGDGHICIPLCIGIFALFRPIPATGFSQTGMSILAGALAVHLIFVGLLGRLPRWMGLGLVIAYGVFLYEGGWGIEPMAQ